MSFNQTETLAGERLDDHRATTRRERDRILEKAFAENLRVTPTTTPSILDTGKNASSYPTGWTTDGPSRGTTGQAFAAPRDAEPLTLENFDDAMQFVPWTPDQLRAGEIVREALTFAGKAILRYVPAGACRSLALRGILDARMQANAGITHRGRF